MFLVIFDYFWCFWPIFRVFKGVFDSRRLLTGVPILSFLVFLLMFQTNKRAPIVKNYQKMEGVHIKIDFL